MQIKSVSAAVALTLLTTTAMAADLPSRRAPPVYVPPPIPTFSWTGLYVGGQVGYAFDRSSTVVTVPGTGAFVGAGAANPDGVIGGAHIGYNYEVQSIPLFGGGLGSGLVIGVEGDVDGSNARSTYPVGILTASTNDPIQGSARGRVGIAVDRALFYATGGAAFGGITNSYFNTVAGGFDTYNRTKVGYTVGGGVEYAITNNWSLRAEYRYTDFGTNNNFLVNTVPGGVARTRETDNRVQAGFSYKFDGFGVPGPVVARY